MGTRVSRSRVRSVLGATSGIAEAASVSGRRRATLFGRAQCGEAGGGGRGYEDARGAVMSTPRSPIWTTPRLSARATVACDQLACRPRCRLSRAWRTGRSGEGGARASEQPRRSCTPTIVAPVSLLDVAGKLSARSAAAGTLAVSSSAGGSRPQVELCSMVRRRRGSQHTLAGLRNRWTAKA